MPPSKRRSKSQTSLDDDNVSSSAQPPVAKKLTRAQREKLIVKAKLDALEQEETLNRDDRLSIDEKQRLLDAYNEHGYHVFHNPELLAKYLTNRRPQDVMGLVQRLQASLQMQQTSEPTAKSESQPDSSRLNEWEKLCSQLTRNFAKDRKINLDDVFTDALRQIASDFRQGQITNSSATETSTTEGLEQPNYAELLDSFAQLMAGKFPEKTSPINGQISRQVFDHINTLVDSIDLKPIVELLNGGKWMESDVEERLKLQEMALDGLKQLNGPPTFRDLETNKHIEALCLELPKIKRLTEMLNPLRVNKNLMESANRLDVDNK